jgi:hypothetical protein
MRKKLLIILPVIIIGTSIGLGVYFWLNPLGRANQYLESGTVLLEGTFVEFDSSHYGRGTARIVAFPDGNQELQFVDVDLANGPDLYIYLSNKTTFSGIYDSPGNFISLGLLQYNGGNFSVNVQAGTLLANVNSVLIWCKQFSVVFTYASLN